MILTSPSARLSAGDRRPWASALAVAVPLTVAYLILAPPAGDLAAATYRSELFSRVGFTTWDTGWYAAHGYWLPGYSLLSPALGALLGVRLLLALSAIAACALFALIAERVFDRSAARLAAAWFALGFCVGVLSGRVPFDLGFAIGLASLLALMRGLTPLALALAAMTSVASPVAGAFLAMTGVAGALAGAVARQTRMKTPCPARARGTGQNDDPPDDHSHREHPHDNHLHEHLHDERPQHKHPHERSRPGIDRLTRDCLALTVASLGPMLVLAVAYPDGGYEPFAPSAFWPALVGVALIALLLPQGPLTPRGRLAFRLGSALYALALIGAFAIHTPLGGNAARLGPLLAAPLLAGVLWERRRALLLALTPLLLYWQLATPIRDYSSIAGDPSVHASYYAPVLGELQRLGHGKSTIVEVPMTAAHWESAYLAGHGGIELARGWERQLDTRYAAIFYRKTLRPSDYRAWLAQNRVVYVALPDAPLDKAGRLEGRLIERGLPYLRELWHSEHWRIYRVMG